jgi:hypothetical protein
VPGARLAGAAEIVLRLDVGGAAGQEQAVQPIEDVEHVEPFGQ